MTDLLREPDVFWGISILVFYCGLVIWDYFHED
jgi:hypothetical protein